MRKSINALFKTEKEIVNLNGDFAFAGFWARLTARTLDYLFLLIPVLLVSGAATGTLQGVIDPNAKFYAYSFQGALIWCLYAAAFAVMNTLMGASLGKRVMRLRVVNMEGKKLTFGQSLYREAVGRFLCDFTWWIGYFIAVFSPQKVSLADFLADTRVVYAFKFKMPTMPFFSPQDVYPSEAQAVNPFETGTEDGRDPISNYGSIDKNGASEEGMGDAVADN